MDPIWRQTTFKRRDHRIILHFDYDCFYASVFEAENPFLKSRPLAVQQKQIVVTCNYEARRRGLHKLQLIREARKVCPDVVIVLGEDLTRFRDASKALYNFLRTFSWNDKVERLGFDEVYMDVTDMIEYNIELLNTNNLENSFFGLSRSDPCKGFSFDASSTPPNIFPAQSSFAILCIPNSNENKSSESHALQLRLLLGAHLGHYLRHQLEEQKGYTATVGISTSKLLSKLVGSINKPNAQTTLVPPYLSGSDMRKGNVAQLLDPLEIGKVPGIGFKLALKIRNHVLGRPAKFGTGLVYGATQDHVSVGNVRACPGMNSQTLDTILRGQSLPQGIGAKIWNLLHGIDDTEVSMARSIPKQISIEDTYLHLDTLDKVRKELCKLSQSLLKRMHLDLLEEAEHSGPPEDNCQARVRGKWLAHPRTLRLSTRVRPSIQADGSRERLFNRKSRSGPLPNFIFDVNEEFSVLSEKLAEEAILPLFRRLHSGSACWDLSLINVAVTNMVETAHASGGQGRDIHSMFYRQDGEARQQEADGIGDSTKTINADDVVVPWQQVRIDGHEEPINSERQGSEAVAAGNGTEDALAFKPSQDSVVSTASPIYDRDENFEDEYMVYPSNQLCHICDAFMPAFAMAAHERFHNLGD
ncbi:DNA/RNA polymerase [Xylona heveae TC161]|uniref:DNA/RNA polymerase n=1 Tax=Xylona heveae (strain CBS 132557 / TC161) TaxID=1328760 RepID=A0A165A4T8_XYLHT|nr:DNA/RNA polymerase [Xylona heveae TC161]KZF19950.1 DNA/RNA polymerase [Xylona heveae TC161]